jgi:hypothetical protein
MLVHDSPEHRRERIMPSGIIELVVNLVDDELRISGTRATDSLRRFPGAIVSGCYGTPFELDTRVHAAVIDEGVKSIQDAPGLGA